MVAKATGSARRRPPFGVAAAAALVLTLTACSGSSGGDASLVATSDGAGTTAADVAATTASPPSSVAPSVAVTTAATVPVGPTVDAPGLLARAVEAMRAGYDVDTNVTAGDRSTNLAGRVVGVNSLFTLTSGGASVEYLQVPPQVWVREPGGEWSEATSEAAPKEALTTLSAPATVAFVSAGGDGQHLRVSYPGAALGSESTTIDADMVLEPNGGITVTYAAVTQGKTVAVTTRMAPAADATPIAPPV